MAKVRTSIILDDATVERIKKSAEGKKPARGWTVELVLLAEERLDEQDRKASK